jgi:hypothetical protein
MNIRAAITLVVTTLVSTSALGQGTHLYWGDTHQHSGLSFDVYLFGTPSSTPDTAYNYAKGLPVISPTTQTRRQIGTPLDFMVLADHAELMGAFQLLFAGDPELAATKSGKILLEVGGNQSADELLAVYGLGVNTATGAAGNDFGLTAQDIYQDLHAGERRRKTWDAVIDAAERHNEPGVFTAFIGWEWSAMPAGANLHRVVFTPQGGEVARQFLPYSQMESADPEALWAWLDQTGKQTGADFIAIPHNSNISIGRMFPLTRENGEPVDADYAARRMRWEPVTEATQIKGDSETHPLLSPADPFADFEIFPFVLTPAGLTPDPTEGDYLRSGMKRGLELQHKLGSNPYKTGMIGSTDSHTGMPAVEEANFAGKGQHDARAIDRAKPTGLGASVGWDMAAEGYVGVWATENTRQALFDAFMRKEVYATTGPRITLRLFGGFDFKDADAEASDIAAIGYRKGVPMGGDLKGKGNSAPGFLVAASKDPKDGNLDRIQIVKGWVDTNGESHEKIFDVALSDGRKDGSQPVGNTVDLATGKYTNSIGAAQLTAMWTDPDFDPAQNAFYYARVLQIPTPRYSLLDSIALGIDWQQTGRPAIIQERAYSSPIWYGDRAWENGHRLTPPATDSGTEPHRALVSRQPEEPG